MKQTQATRRLGEQLREKLGYILLFEVSDPRLDLVTLTAVEVAVDRSYSQLVGSLARLACHARARFSHRSLDR